MADVNRLVMSGMLGPTPIAHLQHWFVDTALEEAPNRNS
jgi:hypothetical protein